MCERLAAGGPRSPARLCGVPRALGRAACPKRQPAPPPNPTPPQVHIHHHRHPVLQRGDGSGGLVRPNGRAVARRTEQNSVCVCACVSSSSLYIFACGTFLVFNPFRPSRLFCCLLALSCLRPEQEGARQDLGEYCRQMGDKADHSGIMSRGMPEANVIAV